MNTTYHLSADACLFHADARDALRVIPDNSIDSGVMDPPYALVSIVKRFGSPNAAPAKGNDAYMRASAGFMSQKWDTGECAFDPAFWSEVLRVLKPGAHLVAFGSTRGYHRMACAIEDAGFEIRDSLMWIYGTGFPKSHDVAKGIDRAAGAEREVVGLNPTYRKDQVDAPSFTLQRNQFLTAPATSEAAEWEGWGTALKPAFEPIVLARKPLSESTVAANVCKWRTGALNIAATRIGDEVRHAAYTSFAPCHGNALGAAGTAEARRGTQGEAKEYTGRWPANVCHDGSEEVVGAFPHTHSAGKATEGTPNGGREFNASSFKHGGRGMRIGDPGGSAARFFYSAKASKADRAGSKHPTVKPIALMAWLARLVTPPGGVILDPFAGSGTTGAAAAQQGFKCVLIEREADYVADICSRFHPSIVPDDTHTHQGRQIYGRFRDEKYGRAAQSARSDLSDNEPP